MFQISITDGESSRTTTGEGESLVANVPLTSAQKNDLVTFCEVAKAGDFDADDTAIISDILSALQTGDASWDNVAKDAVARLVTLILADVDISGVITAIETAEGE